MVSAEETVTKKFTEIKIDKGEWGRSAVGYDMCVRVGHLCPACKLAEARRQGNAYVQALYLPHRCLVLELSKPEVHEGKSSTIYSWKIASQWILSHCQLRFLTLISVFSLQCPRSQLLPIHVELWGAVATWPRGPTSYPFSSVILSLRFLDAPGKPWLWCDTVFFLFVFPFFLHLWNKFRVSIYLGKSGLLLDRQESPPSWQ